jgi:hypothetical protein
MGTTLAPLVPASGGQLLERLDALVAAGVAEASGGDGAPAANTTPSAGALRKQSAARPQSTCSGRNSASTMSTISEAREPEVPASGALVERLDALVAVGVAEASRIPDGTGGAGAQPAADSGGGEGTSPMRQGDTVILHCHWLSLTVIA